MKFPWIFNAMPTNIRSASIHVYYFSRISECHRLLWTVVHQKMYHNYAAHSHSDIMSHSHSDIMSHLCHWFKIRAAFDKSHKFADSWTFWNIVSILSSHSQPACWVCIAQTSPINNYSSLCYTQRKRVFKSLEIYLHGEWLQFALGFIMCHN